MPRSYGVVPSEEPDYDHLRPETHDIAGIELPTITLRAPLSYDRSDELATPDHISYVSEDDVDYIQADQNHDTHHRGIAIQNTQHPRDESRVRLVVQPPPTYTLQRYIPRSIVNTLGPIVVVAFYAAVVWVYLLRPPVNDVVPNYPINANIAFYGWVLFSIFVLDWAKSALAGFEASALMNPKLAPRNAMALMWHADRAWGSVSGWWKALMVLYRRLVHLHTHKTTNLSTWQGPDWLWLYLALSSILFYAAIPLASVTMEISSAFRLSARHVVVIGANQTTFDIRSSNIIAEEAATRWRQGNAATPQGETVFYAQEKSQNISGTFFNDAIEAIYRRDLSNQVQLSLDDPISFFSGPQVTDRVYGKAWGLLTNLSCAIANPYTQLTLINMTGVNNWSVPTASINSEDYGTQAPSPGGCSLVGDMFSVAQSFGGTSPAVFAMGNSNLGASYAYLIAVDSPVDSYYGYQNASSFPTNGTLELVMWQAYGSQFMADQESRQLDLYVLGLCYQMFRKLFNRLCKCFITCNPWYSANVATGGSFLDDMTQNNNFTQQTSVMLPTISPARMKLAMYKLFAEASVAMMSSGSGQWTGDLHGLTPTKALVPGPVPWQLVLYGLLLPWAFITVIPSLWTFSNRRWAATLDGLQMFRLGAEWRETIWKFSGSEIRECESLRDLPGMVGDMESKSDMGFIGLSKDVASEKRIYVHDRGSLHPF